MTEKVQQVSSVLTYTGSGVAVWFGTFSTNELAALSGIGLGFLTYITNVYFNMRRLKILKGEK